MHVKNPNYREHVAHVFEAAAHVQALGIEMADVGPGWCEAHLTVAPRHLQQTDVVHAGVIATIADHTAGAAGSTLLAPGEYVLTVEFNLSLLRAARGQRLRCWAEVLKPGRTLSVVEAEVFAEAGGTKRLVAKARVTLAVLKNP